MGKPLIVIQEGSLIRTVGLPDYVLVDLNDLDDSRCPLCATPIHSIRVDALHSIDYCPDCRINWSNPDFERISNDLEA